MKQVQNTDIKLLRVFVTVVRCGGFSSAQSILNIGQSAISEHMNRLETRLGARLCERGRGGFRLTESGEIAYAAAQRLLASVENFRLETSGISGELQGELRLGLIDNIITNSDSPLIPTIRNFHTHAKHVRLHIETRSPNELAQQVLDGRLHAAIGPFPKKIQGLSYEELFEELHLLYCGETHPLYHQDDISEKEVQTSEIIAHSYENSADIEALKAGSAAAIIDNVEAETLLILTGHYIGFLPAHYAERWEKSGELKALLPDQINRNSSFYLITKTGGHRHALLTAFLSDLEECKVQA
ncbi:LysR family transcriptional regulator [Pseudomaricurvus alkylphenolicus]|uniref:LysR family transcriptional regulator n=1 Tax=Pseudomaricurvus alkylphenolicus TaxID=1306991 RepID=UPI001421F375|nr:LysR family transcriptional regulator [Pseudomaricurvus alkylphenolicus]NIB38773.1 LysR family transcriptional regulator [Pseudomaricurvus alkylphenolicus]